ncbi:unnamed protein product [Vitrella brassicaformis CCMP3155]|uniref:Uncharacterized protein n=1 Tax=Vitrella brassicaformis (strain CCMP3155) TaxID=1169540 RepID=A0A0G4EIU1_VITBC|nr:unnamed protein product [Vitrella brassicaformis CCMP3155]|eukprot:CEL95941.1 unnamed protein product [Vitrella brassicaformis CCMP3155]
MAADGQGQQPDGGLRLEDVDTLLDDGSSNATIWLARGVIQRTLTRKQQVTQLIRDGADPNSLPRLRVRGSGSPGLRYRLLTLAIDNLSDGAMPTIFARDSHVFPGSLALPQWSSRELEADIINALIDGGAHLDADRPLGHWDEWPIRMAVCGGNDSAVGVLLARGAAVRQAVRSRHGRPLNDPLLVMRLPLPIAGRLGHQVPAAYEGRLLAIYRRLIQRDATLATERDIGGRNLIHLALFDERSRFSQRFSQRFVDSYLDLLVENGADLTALTPLALTPLHWAAAASALFVADYLCRHVPPADINRGTTGNPNVTPLVWVASSLNEVTEVSQDTNRPPQDRDRAIRRIPLCEAFIRSLLRGGADIGRIPTDSDRHRCRRQLVLPQCTRMLNSDVHTGAMAAVNAALAPQRSLAAFLMRSLPTLLPHLLQPPGTSLANPPAAPLPAAAGYGPHEAEAIGWRIAAMCFDQHAANETITATLTIRNSDLARRVQAAAEHFVKSAVFAASSNREVVGGTADVGGVTVRVPLQCFAIRAESRPHQVVHTHGRLGVREVIHRARLDEAARHGIEEGAINKGFNEHLGNTDCQFGGWQQLGRIDEWGQWVTLSIN